MGYYIQTSKNTGKAEFLINSFKAKPLPKAPQPDEIPEGMVPVCVVNNTSFEAAGIAFDKDELEAFNLPSDLRQKKWLLLDKKAVIELNPMVEGRLAWG